MSAKHHQIIKVELKPSDDLSVSVAKGSNILSAGVEGDRIFVYILEPMKEKIMERWRLYVYGTGSKVVGFFNNLEFIGTVHPFNGEFSFHVFCDKEVGDSE